MVADAQGVGVTDEVLTTIELRGEDGRLLGVLTPGRRLEIARDGIISAFDVCTGRLIGQRRQVRGVGERWTPRRSAHSDK